MEALGICDSDDYYDNTNKNIHFERFKTEIRFLKLLLNLRGDRKEVYFDHFFEKNLKSKQTIYQQIADEIVIDSKTSYDFTEKLK
jgi:hypothetical protein